jgi:hypothetical protein
VEINSPLMTKSPEAWRNLGFPHPPPPRRDWEPCYLGFGHLPEGGRSFAYKIDPRTGKQDGYYENGVGVFRGFHTPDEEYIDDLEHRVHLATVYLTAACLSSEPT